MSDFKSKLPDFQEITSFASKLFKDVKTSVCEIVDEYKKKRNEEDDAVEPKMNANAKPPVHSESDVIASKTKAKAPKTKVASNEDSSDPVEKQ